MLIASIAASLALSVCSSDRIVRISGWRRTASLDTSRTTSRVTSRATSHATWRARPVRLSATADPWYEQGLRFGCTGCGRCCQMDGDVWVSPDETLAIAAHLNLTADDFSAQYTRRRLRGWRNLKQQDGESHGCIFLDDAGQCSIYEARPVQCSTYPWWPSLLKSEDSWAEETVLPDAIEGGPHWSLEWGVCEGIGHAEGRVVDLATIEEQRKKALEHWKTFPGFFIKRRSWRL